MRLPFGGMRKWRVAEATLKVSLECLDRGSNVPIYCCNQGLLHALRMGRFG